MTPVATARRPAIPHAPELSRAERIDLMRTMLRSRRARRRVADERRRRRMPPAMPPATEGWESLEAACARVLLPGDALAAGADWPAPVDDAARRIGAGCRLTEMVSAGLGATIGAPPESIALVLAGPAWGASETAALVTAARRRAPLVVVFAAPGHSATAARTAAGTAGAVFDLVPAAEVEVCTLAIDSACVSARAGQGPTVIACSDEVPENNSRWRRAAPRDPIERYAARLRELGVRA